MTRAASRRTITALTFTLLLAGCGGVDSLLVSESMGFDFRDEQTRTADLDAKPSGLKDIRDPAVFFRSAAELSMQKREYESAARHYASLTALEPENTAHVEALARSLRYLGRVSDSERLLRQALREKPNDLALREELGKVLLASGRLKEGVGQLEALARAPGVPTARRARLRSALGVAFDRAGQHARAQSAYRSALKDDPLNASALNNLGLSYAMSGDLDTAERTLREALVTPHAGEQVRQNLATVLALKGQGVEAERLAMQDLPPTIARQKLAFFSKLSKDGAVWKNANAGAR